MNDKKQENNQRLPARRPFILTGIVVGFLISGWYLYRLHLQKQMPGIQVRIDPVWAQFVNVALIFFASIFQFSLLHKLYAFVVRKLASKR